MVGALESRCGMSVNQRKTRLLNMAWGAWPSPPAILVHGSPIPASPSFRWLGYDLDSRLSFTAHWSATSASCKRSLGAIARLCGRDPVALRHFFKERVTGLLLRSLPYLPPSTALAWRQLNKDSAFAARIHCGFWGKKSHTEIGVPAPPPNPIAKNFTRGTLMVLAQIWQFPLQNAAILGSPPPQTQRLRRHQRWAPVQIFGPVRSSPVLGAVGWGPVRSGPVLGHVDRDRSGPVRF